MQKRELEVAELNLQTVKLKDDLLKVKKEAERATEKTKALTMPTAPASVREAKLQKEIDRCMVRSDILPCSTRLSNMLTTYAENIEVLDLPKQLP